MNHGELLGAVAGRARALGLRVAYHPDSRQDQYDLGFPDLVIAGGGLVLFAEIKGRDGVLSEGQRDWAAVLAGGETHQHAVIWPADWESGTVEIMLRAMAARRAVI